MAQIELNEYNRELFRRPLVNSIQTAPDIGLNCPMPDLAYECFGESFALCPGLPADNTRRRLIHDACSIQSNGT
jgi:hypothetical protein